MAHTTASISLLVAQYRHSTFDNVLLAYHPLLSLVGFGRVWPQGLLSWHHSLLWIPIQSWDRLVLEHWSAFVWGHWMPGHTLQTNTRFFLFQLDGEVELQSFSQSIDSMTPEELTQFLCITRWRPVGDVLCLLWVSLHPFPRHDMTKVVDTFAKELTFARLYFESNRLETFKHLAQMIQLLLKYATEYINQVYTGAFLVWLVGLASGLLGALVSQWSPLW